ncbi:hypothetical protein NQ318_004751 [Aromia moschata]|uniref:Uncharacterized protein n=1 Tax=Aromia moschata TaxID=1265417 RepID=A0AAV8XYF9_9CUCU|nr:hypothetical protein NQ318_004751 [Aromia moschata]
MKILIFCAALIVGSQAVSFFDLVQEQWGAFKNTFSQNDMVVEFDIMNLFSSSDLLFCDKQEFAAHITHKKKI